MRSLPVAVVAVVMLASGAARAGNPDTDVRAGQVAPIFAEPERFCEGGPENGQACTDGFCTFPSQCSGIRGVSIKARGVLTVIADTILQDPLPANPFREGIGTNPGTGADELQPVSCATCEGQPGHSSFTLLLEYTKDGKSFVFANTYPGVTNEGSVDSFDAQLPGGPFVSDWQDGALETQLVDSFTTQPYKIRWGLLPPDAAKAIGLALGLGTQVPLLVQSNEVPICTDPVSCNLCSGPPACNIANTLYSRHSAANDTLGSVRRFKVDIGVIAPAP